MLMNHINESYKFLKQLVKGIKFSKFYFKKLSKLYFEILKQFHKRQTYIKRSEKDCLLWRVK